MKYNDEVWSRLKPRAKTSPVTQQRQSSRSNQANRHQQKKATASKDVGQQKQRAKQSTRGGVVEKEAQPKKYGPSMRSRAGGLASNTKEVVRGAVSRLTADKQRLAIGLVGVFVVGSIAAVITLANGDSRRGDDTPQSLGVSEETDRQIELPELPEATPSFSLLFPSSANPEEYRTVRVSPEGNAPAYTYLDDISGTTVQVTQQQIGDIPSFEGLGAVAEDFQATDVVQLDDTLIYYGINERSGVQSVITEKEQILILIVSPRQLAEEVWVSYIASLE